MQEVTESLDLYTRLSGLLDSKVNPLGKKIDELSSKVETLTTNHAVNAAQMATHEARIAALESWKNNLPDKEIQNRINKANLTWQSIGGWLGIGAFVFFVLQHVRLIW